MVSPGRRTTDTAPGRRVHTTPQGTSHRLLAGWTCPRGRERCARSCRQVSQLQSVRVEGSTDVGARAVCVATRARAETARDELELPGTVCRVARGAVWGTQHGQPAWAWGTKVRIATPLVPSPAPRGSASGTRRPAGPRSTRGSIATAGLASHGVLSAEQLSSFSITYGDRPAPRRATRNRPSDQLYPAKQGLLIRGSSAPHQDHRHGPAALTTGRSLTVWGANRGGESHGVSGEQAGARGVAAGRMAGRPPLAQSRSHACGAAATARAEGWRRPGWVPPWTATAGTRAPPGPGEPTGRRGSVAGPERVPHSETTALLRDRPQDGHSPGGRALQATPTNSKAARTPREGRACGWLATYGVGGGRGLRSGRSRLPGTAPTRSATRGRCRSCHRRLALAVAGGTVRQAPGSRSWIARSSRR